MSITAFRMPATPIGLYRPAWRRVLDAWAESWRAWRASVRQRAAERALAALDPRILKDVGLGEFASRPSARPQVWQMLERARW